tara:strand:+ start:26 stop:223 length:198 start_codon:yes stop_codon:yes gene_type:complete
MAKKTTTKEIPTAEDVLPALDANDINILYTLVQQASITVSDVPAVAPVLDKCKIILENVNQKING